MKIQLTILYATLATFLLCALPVRAYAINAFVDLPETFARVGNTVLLMVSIKTDGKEINAVEGKIAFSDPTGIVSVTTGGSIFSHWPQKPSLEGNIISFAGGTPSGVFGNSLRLFTVAVKPTSVKPIKISFENVTAYLNDGFGTEITVLGSPVEISVFPTGDAENEFTSLVASDTVQPLPFSIDLGRDASLYGGRYFISFYATDNESGISHYEVRENGYPMTRAENIYVLQDQSLSGAIEVRAFDNAGNIRVQTLELSARIPWMKIILLTIVLALAIFLTIRFLIIKKFFIKKR